jgi:hypothetical protein
MASLERPDEADGGWRGASGGGRLLRGSLLALENRAAAAAAGRNG